MTRATRNWLLLLCLLLIVTSVTGGAWYLLRRGGQRANLLLRAQGNLRRGEFEFAVDRKFAAVVSACSKPRATDTGTWITPNLAAAYCDLFQRGYAHSVEAYADGQLVGGVYGVAIGGFFAGESMFHRRCDASKAALFHLVARLQQRGFSLFDVQQASGHMTRLGATEISRERYLRQLRDALRLPVRFR